jgi:Xaa-Pro aminopeptidase
MHQEQRDLTRRLLAQHDVDAALFAHPHSVTWLTGFTAPVQAGVNPFAGGPALVWYAGGRFTLFVSDVHAALAEPFSREPDGAVVTYLGYTVDAPIEAPRHLRKALQAHWLADGIGRASVGVEVNDMPAAIYALLGEMNGKADLPQALDGLLLPARAIKTAEEIDKLRANFRLTDIGHAAARAATRPGVREIDIWTAAEAAIQQAAGQRVPVTNDCIVGTREINFTGWPLDLPVREGDSVIVDLSTIQYGYWSDSCATYVAGAPSARHRELHAVISATLAYGASLLRPGAVAGDIDKALRKFIADAGYAPYTHHSGHGVGVSGHEAPRIVPYSREVLAPGMVIMLEPGIYFPGETGVRLEDAFLITASGAEQLTQHDKRLTFDA